MNHAQHREPGVIIFIPQYLNMILIVNKNNIRIIIIISAPSLPSYSFNII